MLDTVTYNDKNQTVIFKTNQMFMLLYNLYKETHKGNILITNVTFRLKN